MRRRRKSIALAAAVVTAVTAAVLVVFGPTQSATASTIDFTPQRVLAPGLPTDGSFDHNVVPLGSVTLDMVDSQTAYLVSVMRVNSATIRSLFDNEIVCQGPDGWSHNMVIGQNVYQKGSSPTWDDVTLTTRFLVQPDSPGQVTCTAQIRAASLSHDDATVQLVSGSLRVADSSVDNASDGSALQQSVPGGSVLKVDGSQPTVRQPSLDEFDLDPGFTGLSVFGDTEFMICHPSTSCDKYGTTTAKFTLFVNQWKEDGSLCHSDNSASVTMTVPYWVHHIYVPLHNPDFEISTAEGCVPTFNAYVKVDWLGGESGGVQGTAIGLTDGRGTPEKHDSDMSHVFVVPF